MKNYSIIIIIIIIKLIIIDVTIILFYLILFNFIIKVVVVLLYITIVRFKNYYCLDFSPFIVNIHNCLNFIIQNQSKMHNFSDPFLINQFLFSMIIYCHSTIFSFAFILFLQSFIYLLDFQLPILLLFLYHFLIKFFFCLIFQKYDFLPKLQASATQQSLEANYHLPCLKLRRHPLIITLLSVFQFISTDIF